MMSGCAIPQLSFPWKKHETQTPSEQSAKGEKRAEGAKAVEDEAVKRVIQKISANPGKDKTVVNVLADGPFEYISYKMENPSRLVVEISNAMAELSSPDVIRVEDGVINVIRVISFERANVVRVEMGLRNIVSYETSLKGSALEVVVKTAEDPALAEAHDRLLRATRRVAEQANEISSLKSRVRDLESVRQDDSKKIAQLEAQLEVARQKAATAPEPEAEPADKPAEEPPAGPSEEEEKQGVISAVRQWADAWQAKDIGRYAECYDASFENDGEALDAWVDSKRNKFLQAGDIEIIIEGIEVTVDGERAEARFTQRYNSEKHSDVGVKTLVMVKTGKGWRITEENWSPLP